MRKSFVFASLLTLLVGCEGAAAEAPRAAPSAPGVTVSWAAARVPTDRALLEAPARAVAGAGGQARVAPPFPARVVSIAVAPGDVVREGDVLLEVTMPAVLDAAAIWTASGSARALRTQRRGELEALRQEGLVEQSRVFEQETSLAALDADRARALAVLHAAGVRPGSAGRLLARGTTSIVSPIAGVVSVVDAHLGEMRDPAGAPLVEVLGTAPARIEARLARALPEGARLVFAPLGGEAIELRSTPDASVIDPSDGMRVVWLAPSEPLALPDGLRGTLRVLLAREGVIEIPAGAVGHETAGPFVVRRGADGPVRTRVVVLASGAGTAIVEGLGDAVLAPGDEVATDASLLLRAPEADE